MFVTEETGMSSVEMLSFNRRKHVFDCIQEKRIMGASMNDLIFRTDEQIVCTPFFCFKTNYENS